ncbi:BfmA/BtgA family mobilization protein [Pseudozobellia sp. WGM2]|uniref:BfmA/BtgA family mobilization protein n=1 Tax=Pseudozobellia sp. WGM2 TaxID=2787625 RepID=UPI001ADFA33B|nr:BfmA/BtgA family mobilization protein [Pseudozobellia sp. WGM2]
MSSKETFSTLRIKIPTAEKFRKFSKQLFKTHSDALQTMLDFFHYNEISPLERFGPTARTLETLIKKRFNAMAAIMKEMDKRGITPTKAMMELLFEHAPQQNKPQKSPSSNKGDAPVKDDAFFKSAFETIELQKANSLMEQNLQQLQQQFLDTLKKVEVTKSSFGKSKLYLNMPIREYEQLKASLKQTEPCTSVLQNNI